ncbi:phosphorylase b kinase regulatory subunit beta-like [Limosa lapponica baueri]|uniref:Phosphorylase b kinase regulatory subunit n=1 Tax=Limosa lapponica baueri TaxID=1758121 RepID=A0A2I0T5S1_LIMLA|nr:phosphorylase b kinase regulatory subunit beta-like [Limosa lapponica baueri]
MFVRIDDDKGRTHELEHSAIKCMRGILYCYMRQADKVQQFKQDPKPSGCLHSVFNAHTGDEVFSHKEYGHLQLSQFVWIDVRCVVLDEIEIPSASFGEKDRLF